MFKSKRFIVGVVLVAVILAGSIGGAVLAADNGDGDPVPRHEAMLDRVSEIYEQNTGVAIDQEALKDAFAQAQDEGRTEAMQNRLQTLVEEGKITQEQADEKLDWLGQKPDFPAGFGFKSRGARGKMGMRGFGGPCAPTE